MDHVRTKILIEDCPPKKTRGFHLWIGAVALIVGIWTFLAVEWIILKIESKFPAINLPGLLYALAI
jgi:hypothetical protein